MVKKTKAKPKMRLWLGRDSDGDICITADYDQPEQYSYGDNQPSWTEAEHIITLDDCGYDRCAMREALGFAKVDDIPPGSLYRIDLNLVLVDELGTDADLVRQLKAMKTIDKALVKKVCERLTH